MKTLYITVRLKNKLPYLLRDMSVYTIQADPENPSDYEMHDVVKKVMLFPYETYTFDIVIDGEAADRFRKSGLKYTYCMYDLKWLSYLEKTEFL